MRARKWRMEIERKRGGANYYLLEWKEKLGILIDVSAPTKL